MTSPRPFSWVTCRTVWAGCFKVRARGMLGIQAAAHLFLHQKCSNVKSSGHKEPQIVIFNHLMLVDANCDDSVTIPRCPNLVVNFESECGTEKKLSRAYACILGTPPISNCGSTPALGQH